VASCDGLNLILTRHINYVKFKGFYIFTAAIMKVTIYNKEFEQPISYVWLKYMMFKKELNNSIPNVTVRQVLRKRLHLKAYKLPIVQGVEKC
jgi:hypothetical protein